uniref:DNA repair protein RAD5 n=1 Tax=Mycena chlorophos TaxID=658473 RepID=A0ABQ0LFY7_MYCCL|nr:DNA repair protein RAD5 [Mycena chlorophos]
MPPRKSSTTAPKANAAPACDDSNPALAAEEEIPLPTHASPKTKAQADAELRDFLDGGAGGEGLRGDDSRVRGLRDDIRLKPHQVKGRLWMKEREDPAQKKFGGILADDMGVGKTLQTIACILDRRRTKDQAASGWSKATLVICPLAVVPHWETEITTKTTDLKTIVYHGSRREALAPKLPNADVVITTYSTLQAEHSRGKDTLTKVKWLRVVLDEAHTIKNRATKTAAACFDLKALFRWCLTATPMQNTVEDFFSLFHFLHIKPLNEWSRFSQLIAGPIDKGHGDAGLAMKRLQVVLKHVLLRRMKSQLECLKLPNKTVKLISCPFDAQELAFYRALKDVSNAILKRLLKNKEMDGSRKYMNILVLLLRLRQACDHPRLALKDYEEALSELEQEEGPHVIPKTFLDVDSETEDEADGRRKPRRCQGCSARLTRTSMAGKDWPEFCVNCAALQVQTENLSGPLRPSAKVKRIVRILKGVPWGEKTVIFSQWTSFFDLLEPFLMGMGVKYTRYDGSMTMDERAAALHEISTDPRMTVILVSLKAGGQGLNLTACNHVILADMWWNPAVEEQAFDRTHRVGQTRDVHVYKLRVEETVEDRILELQERKRELAKTALSASWVKGVKLSLEELVNLFK